ncbi:DJ-1/PfpI family protein [Sphingosinicella sp.]|uniref:DJ-1/PfpI family protein n=1 Tax=Sphingosinicella sp. TaxID=1917971 RepID=UPI0026262A90|nr:DJ-1/PfpI family protein [Sphingosinicella sp.]
MAKKILFIVTSHGELGSSGNASGSWLEELATPYWQFVDAGFDVAIASPKGGKAPIDPMSLEDAWISDNGRRFLADATASAKLNGTQPLESIRDEGLDGIFLVGGTATTWDFPHNPVIKRLAETLFARGDVVAGICHGVIGRRRGRGGRGRWSCGLYNVSRPQSRYVSDVLAGKRGLADRIANALGYERHVVFRRGEHLKEGR